MLASFTDVIDAHAHGFGPTQASYFRFDGPLDEGALPDEAASLAPGAEVFLVDVTPGGAHRGERSPVRVRFSAAKHEYIGPDWLAVQPVPGFVPREGATYAAVVLDGVGARAPAALRRVLDGIPDGDVETRAVAVYAPLAAWLDEQQLRERVAAATVYTTFAGSAIMDELRTAVYATPAPSLSALAWVRDGGAYDLYTGRYDGPNFQEGDPPYDKQGGSIHRGADGKPQPVRTESLRVALTIPKGPMPAAGWPVVLYAHGTGGDYLSFVADGTAGRLALVADAAGGELARLAVVSIDQVLHGPRAPAGTDVELAFFNLNNFLAARDNPKQGALDDFQLVRLIHAVDVGAAPTTGLPIRFDASKLYFFGHSQGSLTGALFVGAEPSVKAAIFSGAGAGLVSALLTKTKPIDIAAIVQAFFRDPVDDFHPFLNLLQSFYDESDPASHVRRFFVEPPGGAVPKSVFVSIGLRDSYAPVPTIETFALAAGVQAVAPMLLPIDHLALRGAGPEAAFAAAPQAGNAPGGATGVVCEYDPGPNDDGHFVVFDVASARAQTARFLATHAQGGTAVLSAP